MRVLLVTSEVTYMPRNYEDLFRELLERIPHHLVGMVKLKNFSWIYYFKAIGLYLMGCRKLAVTLFANLVRVPARRHEKLFESKKVPVITAASMNDPQMIQWVQQQNIDLIINLRTRCIYREPILSAPKLGCVNIHHGLLPEYRGTLCDLYALSENRPAGFTIHAMNSKIDAGLILVRKEVSQSGEKDYLSYLERTGREEGVALSELVEEVSRTGKFPSGTPNQCIKPVYTRNPTRRQIKKMKSEGMVL